MNFKRMLFWVIALVCINVALCSAATPVTNDDLTVNGIHLGMDRNQVEKVVGDSRGTEKYLGHVVYVYDRGKVKIVYKNDKVMRMKITDRTWKNGKGIHCGCNEQNIESLYGSPAVFSDEPSEKSYTYFTDNFDTIEFIAIEGYVQEIIVEGKKDYL